MCKGVDSNALLTATHPTTPNNMSAAKSMIILPHSSCQCSPQHPNHCSEYWLTWPIIYCSYYNHGSSSQSPMTLVSLIFSPLSRIHHSYHTNSSMETILYNTQTSAFAIIFHCGPLTLQLHGTHSRLPRSESSCCFYQSFLLKFIASNTKWHSTDRIKDLTHV